jgi:hypothetical protein
MRNLTHLLLGVLIVSFPPVPGPDFPSCVR